MTSVLIVEDDADLRVELADYLTSLGYAVQCVGLLSDAEQLMHQSFELVLLDINLPDGSGMDFCMRLRPYVRAGIVMLTGRSEHALRLQSLHGGADAYLVKPVDPAELDATLRSVVRRVGHHNYSIVQVPAMPVQWLVDRVRLTLSGPNAKWCKLNSGESILLGSMLQAQGQQIARKDLLEAFDQQGLPTNGRRLETLISRLRRKVLEEIGLELPIHSVYGQGYAFRDHARVI